MTIPNVLGDYHLKEHSKPILPNQPAEFELWGESRSGAQAGRGFSYQYLVSALILVRQWAGLAPPGFLIPEGFEDCVIELPDRRIWIQIRSRQHGTFRGAEVSGILDSVQRKHERLTNSLANFSTVILEQPRTEKVDPDITSLFEDQTGQVYICENPRDEILQVISSNLDTAEVLADGLATELYWLVARASEQNASLSYNDRRKITTTEVEQRFVERLTAEDPSAIDHILVKGAIKPVDLTTPIDEPDFYRGVKVEPGHVAANLVLERPKDVTRVRNALLRNRHVLVYGPSGAGKSALTWLVTSDTVGQMRWYQITGLASVAETDAIVRFVRSRQPSQTSPIGLVFDEIGSTNCSLWNVLVRELHGIANVYLLGTVRQEDVEQIVNQSDTAFVQVVLDEVLAQSVWEKLYDFGFTEWTHWREPYEQSDGLMLEYVHLLTEGSRLDAVIGDQIRCREQEDRDHELKIIRSVAVICAHGGEVVASRLFEILGLSDGDANFALKRLIDEHLVRETQPGILGGLHGLRTQALVNASHDEIVYRATETLWASLGATTCGTLPRVVHAILANSREHTDNQSLSNLSDVLVSNYNADHWTAILTGLGLGTLERHVATFLSILEDHGVQRAHWSLASMFSDPSIDFPNLPGFDQWKHMQSAVLEFRALPKYDLRVACLALLPGETAPPPVVGMAQANRMLSCLAPICGGDSIESELKCEPNADEEQDVRHIAKLLSAAYLVAPHVAHNLVDSLGGEQALFNLYHEQIPWTSPPIIEQDGKHVRTVRSNWFYVAEQHQPDPHETVCNACETLIALSPLSNAAASDAVDPAGNQITVGDHKPWSKDIPRKNLPPKPRVAWNVAFRQLLLARSGEFSLTDYTRQIALLVCRTEKIFRMFTEKWITGKQITTTMESEIHSILESVSGLSYTAPQKTPSTMIEPSTVGTEDTLGSFLIHVLGNLTRRLSTYETTKAVAVFSGSLHGQGSVHCQSEIWRTITSPPLVELERLCKRLYDVSCILHEMADQSGLQTILRFISARRKRHIGNAVRAAALHCRQLAERRFITRLRELENVLSDRGLKSKSVSRTIPDHESPYWPAREVAILIETEELITQWMPNVEEILSIGVNHLKNDWPFTAVPVINGKVVASLAVLPSSHITLPNLSFAHDWSEFVGKPLNSTVLSERFSVAVDACYRISAIVKIRGLGNLHSDEEVVLTKAMNDFKSNQEVIRKEAERMKMEQFELACYYLERIWNKLVSEFEAEKEGRPIDDPLCMTPYQINAGNESEHVTELAAVRLTVLQGECNI